MNLENWFLDSHKKHFFSLFRVDQFFCNWFFHADRKYTFWLVLLLFFCLHSMQVFNMFNFRLAILLVFCGHGYLFYNNVNIIIFIPSVLCNQKICNSLLCLFGITKWRLSYFYHWFCVVHFMLFILLGLFFLLSIYLNSKIHK